MSESFAELFEESLKTVELKSGSIITGVVVDIDSEWVTVHAGLKSEGVIPRGQFLNEKGELEIEIGDTVKVAMDAVDDGFGETKLSREKAKRNESWEVLEKVYQDSEVIQGYISGRVLGKNTDHPIPGGYVMAIGSSTRLNGAPTCHVDPEGRFEISGGISDDKVELHFFPSPGMPYTPFKTEISLVQN